MIARRRLVLVLAGLVVAAPLACLAQQQKVHRVGVLMTGSPTAMSNAMLQMFGELGWYGMDAADSYRRAARYVDRILRGAKAAELAVESPTKFQLIVNLGTAKALGLSIPQPVLLRADRVIE